MSQWSHAHAQEMAALGYDPDAIRDELEEQAHLPAGWVRCGGEDGCGCSFRHFPEEGSPCCPLCGSRSSVWVDERERE